MPKVFARPIRVYADTSVFGGALDEEFAKSSRAFFEQVRAGRFQRVVSALVESELTQAPGPVKDLYEDLSAQAEPAPVTPEALQLQEAYLRAGIVGPRWQADALHVAVASVSACRILVSWNFEHIVHFDKIALYNAVNITHGFPQLGIHTPQEVIAYEDEEV